MPAFIVGDDEWEELAHILVRNAGLIVFYFYSASTGVVQELELIRREGRQGQTLVVIEENDPFEDSALAAAMTGAKRDESIETRASLEDFPHQVRRRKDSDWEQVNARLADMAARDWPPPVDARIGLPREFRPPDPVLQFCTQEALRFHDEAMDLVNQKDYERAEDLLTRSLAFTLWARDRLGTAMTLMTLGGLSLKGFEAAGDAGSYLHMALAVADETRADSPTAEDIYTAVTKQIEKLKAQAGMKD